jgi:ribosomal-protein-alanine N-acetyltransferase
MRLEPATTADAPAMAALHIAAFDAPWGEAAITQLLTSPGGFGIVARDEAQPPAGFILARAIAGEAEILTLAVDPAARRGGIGRALLAAAIGLAQADGAVSMFLEVAEDNAAALGLYARAGFVEAGRRRGYYSRPGGAAVDARVLRLDLNSGRA